MATQTPDIIDSAINSVRGRTLREALRSAAADPAGRERVFVLVGEIRRRQILALAASILAGTIAIVALLFAITRLSGGTFLTEDGAGRPILMLLVVLATVVYGGLLINSALTTDHSPRYEDQFRRAREIFLVFSGICGTVVGFYFGSDANSDRSQPPDIAVSDTLGDDGTITITVAGGTAPYEVSLRSEEERLELTPAGAGSFTLGPSATVCPAGGEYIVTAEDGVSYPSGAVTPTREELAQNGWGACVSRPVASESPTAGQEDAEASDGAGGGA